MARSVKTKKPHKIILTKRKDSDYSQVRLTNEGRELEMLENT